MNKELLTPRDDIFVIRNFLSPEECDKLIQRAESVGFGEAPINTFGGGTVVNKNMRNNERVIVDDYDLAKELWPRLRPFIPDKRNGAKALNERFRFYRYEPGQFFDWHFDAIFARPGEASALTFMIYLNECEGGTTELHMGGDGPVHDDDDCIVKVKPEKGMAFIFTHNVLHRGAPVTGGQKYVLRSDVMYYA